MSKYFSRLIRTLGGAFLSFIMVLIAMPAKADIAGLDVQLSPVSGQYDNGSQIEYTLMLTNTSGSTLSGLEVKDEIMNIMTSGDSGGPVNAFESAEISASASFLSSAGDFNSSDDLVATNVRIRDGGVVTYVIKAIVSDEATGPIENVASVNSGALSTESSNTTHHERVVYSHDVDITVSRATYSVGQSLEYSLKITNTGTAIIKGMSVTDLVADIKSNDVAGDLVSAFSSVSNSATTIGGSTNAGSFSPTGNLQADDVTIAVGGSVTYSISGLVSGDLLGDIVNSSVLVETRDDSIKASSIKTPPAEAKVSLSHSLNKSDDYLVEDEVTYTVTAQNESGAGIAYDYTVQQLLDGLVTDLGNDVGNNKNADDISGNPYEYWTNEVSRIGPNSLSELESIGGESGTPLNDKVTIYPGEEIVYTIATNISPVTIGKIPKTAARILDADGEPSVDEAFANALDTERVLNSSSSQIKRTKTTSDTQYIPGISSENEVVYEILVSNTDSKYFANDVEIVDSLTCIVTKQVDGSMGSAFSEWKLEPDTISGDGSNYGSFMYDRWIDNDISIKADIAPSGYVSYKLTAKVSDTSVGQIVDEGADACLGDNIHEAGSGVQMPNPNLKVQKEVNSRYYSAGSTLEYTITLENNGNGYAIDVPVYDDLVSVTTESYDGSIINAYTSWNITAVSYTEDGSTSSVSHAGFDGSIDGNHDNEKILDVLAAVAPREKVVYTINVLVNPLADGEIRNSVLVDDVLYSDRGAYPREYYLLFDKRVDDNDESSRYTDTTETIKYTLTVTNPEGNGFASNINIVDEIGSIEAELLEPTASMTTKRVFESWKIEAQVKADSPWVEAVTDPGSFSNDSDLNVIAQIPPGATITYTIIGKLDRSVDTEILWGAFKNTATITGEKVNLSDTVTTYPDEPNLVVSKLPQSTAFEVGKPATFDIWIYNRGIGYANDATVKDEINSLNFFSSWDIIPSKNVDKPGSRYGQVENNKDIDTDVDITPNGWIHYEITGIVNDDYALEQVSNVVEVYDPITDRDHDSSAQIDNIENEYNVNVSISKTTDVVRYTPGEELIYTIVVSNNDDKPENGLYLIDRLSEIKTTLANHKNGTAADVYSQNPFKEWSYSIDGGAYTVANTDDVIIPLSIPAEERITINIKAIVKDNAVSNGVKSGEEYLIRNEAFLVHKDYVECTSSCEYLKRAVAENHQVHNDGGVVRTTNISRYSPGSELIYTIKYYSQNNHGYRNNVKVEEMINDISVELLDGPPGNPFYDDVSGTNKFTVSVAKSDPTNEGTTDGTLDGQVKDDNDIDTVIDIDEGEYVTYIVKGTVRPDAIGNIRYHDTLVIPNDYHLNFDKSTDENVYEPGKQITYRLTIENDGLGNAHDINVTDELSKITTELLDGNSGKALSGWTITSNAEGEHASYVNAGDGVGNVYSSKDNDIDLLVDIPKGTTLEYKVVATVNDHANGKITNTLTVDGDTIAHQISQDTRQINYEKRILAYYDVDGNEMLGATKYMPGGYVEYEIVIENISSAHIDDMPFRDDIDQIETDYYNGDEGPAFDGWTIDVTSDDSKLTNPDVDGTIVDDQPIDTKFDLAADGFSSTVSHVRYVIRAHIDPRAVGTFRNTAYIAQSDKFRAVSPLSSMADSKIKFTKQAFYDADFSKEKTTYSQESGESTVFYKVQIKNNGDGTEYGSRITDTISAIQTRIAEDSLTSGRDPVGKAFVSWFVSLDKDAKDDSITDAIGFVPGGDIDIENDIVIAPHESITFTIAAVIREDALGDIQNVANYDGKKRKVILFQLANNINVEKKVVAINGKSFSVGDTYVPGDEVEYEFIVSNPENGWANDVRIQDTVTDIGVEVIGGTNKSAFVSGAISHTTSNGIDSDIDTYVPAYSPSGNLDIEVDLAAGEALTFNLKGIVRDDALGDIEPNRVVADGKSATSESIPTEAASLNYFKTLEYTDGDASCTLPSSHGSGCEYAPRGDVVYHITLQNTGNSIANDVSVIDAIDNIKTSDGVSAFSAWNTSISSLPVSSYDISGNYNGSVPLNAKVDLRPGDSITFEVRGTVNEAATGTITNTAQINGNNTNDIVLNGGTAVLLIQKSTSTPEYVPGGTVKYTILVTNNDPNPAKFRLVDKIDDFMVDTVGGTPKVALSTWKITKAEEIFNSSISSGSGANDFSELYALKDKTDQNIDIEMQLAGRNDTGTGERFTVIQIDIEGQVQDDAIGRFTNALNVTDLSGASAYDKSVSLAEGYIKPKPGQLVLTKETMDPSGLYGFGSGATDVTDASDAAKNGVSYKITLANDGEGYLVDQVLIDRIDTIMTDVANSSDQELAFTGNWVISDEKLGGSGDQKLNVRKNELNTSQGYSATYSIHPGDSYSFVVTNKVNKKAKGEITNEVTVDSDGVEYRAEATYRPAGTDIQITKDVDHVEYLPGESLQYTVSVSNNGGMWAEGVKIQDTLTALETELAGGITGAAFASKSIEISATSLTGETPVPAPTKGEDLDALIDIAPGDSVTFTIKAITVESAIGEITNIASATFDGSTIDASVLSTAALATVTIDKTVDFPTYEVTRLVNYSVKVTNSSLAFASNVSLKDIVSGIVVETASGSIESAFQAWEVTYEQSDEHSFVSKNTFELSEDIDVRLDIAPESSVTFNIRALVTPTAIADITNTASILYNGAAQESTVVITPQETDFIATKTNIQAEYEPGEELEFLITIENVSNNYITDLHVVDDMDTIIVDYFDGTEGPAFVTGTTSLVVESESIGSNVEQISPTEYSVDIAPKGTIVFRAKGTVVDNATGKIINTAKVDGGDIVSPPVPSVVAVVKAELFTEALYYVPGEQVEYHLIIENIGRGIAKNVAIYTRFSQVMGDYIDGSRASAFDGWELDADWSGAETQPGRYTNNQDIATLVDISPGGKIDYTFTVTINEDMLTNIDVVGYYLDLTSDPRVAEAAMARAARPGLSDLADLAEIVEALDLPPVPAELVVEKRSDKPEYTPDDDSVTYYLAVTNQGDGNAANVRLTDEISELQNEAGNKVFTDWTIEGVEVDGSGSVIERHTFPASEDLDLAVNLKSKKRNAFAFEVVGTLGKGLDDDITNTFTATESNGTQTSDSVTTHIKKIPDNSGELLLTKAALQDTAQVGDAVEYEVTVENNNESYFKNVTVEDRYPGGFKYILDTSEVVLSGPDGEFGNEDDRVLTIEPSDTGKLLFTSLNFDPGEKLRIRYLLRVSVGATFGDYINTAVSKVDGLAVSNEDSAKVTVEPDKVFDTSSIIGKVFEDHNKDGFQADATAFDVELIANLPTQDYIAGSTIVVRDGKELSVEDEQDNGQVISAVQEGVELGDLWGYSINRTISETKSVAIQFKTRTRESFDFTVTSDGGSRIEFDAQGQIKFAHESDKKNGLSAENLNVTRNLYRHGDAYLWEIVIENKGVYEDGIPGVKLMTVEGIVIHTDQYGRYHVPDQWVLNKKGKNFLVKLDTDSLPTSMEVVSENPKVLRITPNKLTKFNFSVHRKAKDIEQD